MVRVDKGLMLAMELSLRESLVRLVRFDRGLRSVILLPLRKSFVRLVRFDKGLRFEVGYGIVTQRKNTQVGKV